MTTRIPRTHSLNEVLDTKLEKTAKTENKTKSHIVRDALNQYFEKKEK